MPSTLKDEADPDEESRMADGEVPARRGNTLHAIARDEHAGGLRLVQVVTLF